MNLILSTDHDHLAAIAANPTVGIQVDETGRPLCGGVCFQVATRLTRWYRVGARMCHCESCVVTPACAQHVLIWQGQRRLLEATQDVAGALARSHIAAAVKMPPGWRLGDPWPGGELV